MAECYFHRIAGRTEEGRAVAEHAVRCATRYPQAWFLLGDSIFAQADAIRHARIIGAPTPEQLDFCSKRYAEQLLVLLRAVELDPGSSDTWMQVCTAAAFAGIGELADAAYWKAMDLDPESLWLYTWGLELFQPKWYGDEEKLARVVRMAAAVGRDWDVATRLRIACKAVVIGEHFGPADLGELARPLLQTDAERTELKQRLDRHRRECSDHPATPSPHNRPLPADP